MQTRGRGLKEKSENFADIISGGSLNFKIHNRVSNVNKCISDSGGGNLASVCPSEFNLRDRTFCELFPERAAASREILERIKAIRLQKQVQ